MRTGDGTALEAELFEHGADVAVAHIDRYGKLVRDRRLRSDPLRVTEVLSPLRRPFGVDHLELLIKSANWSEGSERRIVIVGSGLELTARGRTTIEEVVFLAERNEIVVHAIDIFRADQMRNPFDDALRDASWFLEKPLESLGRVPRNGRHAVLQSGGTYAVVVTPPNPNRVKFVNGVLVGSGRNIDEIVRRRKKAVDVRTLYGPRKGARGPDALDELASGKRRHFEYTPSDLPSAIRHIDLEPLMDAVFDYVDAREVIASYLSQLATIADPPEEPQHGTLGAAFGRAVAGPRKLPPSRR